MTPPPQPSPRDEAQVRLFVENMAMFLADWGFPRMAARVLMVLMAADEDAVMQALAGGGRDAFYAQERHYREASGAPPFGRLAAVIVSGADGDKVRDIARQLGRAAPNARDVKVWGPTPAFYALLRGQTRERLLVQAAKNVDMQAYLKTWLALVKIPGAVRVAVDVDPVSFF